MARRDAGLDASSSWFERRLFRRSRSSAHDGKIAGVVGFLDKAPAA